MSSINNISSELVLCYYDALDKVILDEMLNKFESSLKMQFRIKFQSSQNIKSINLYQELLMLTHEVQKSAKNSLILSIYKHFETILIKNKNHEKFIEYDSSCNYNCYYYFNEEITEKLIKFAFRNLKKKFYIFILFIYNYFS